MLNIEDLLKQMVECQASDFLIVADTFPTTRSKGGFTPLFNEQLTASTAHSLIYSLLNNEQIKRFKRTYELDFSYVHPLLGRYRVNLHYQKGSVAAVIRYFSSHIPLLKNSACPIQFVILLPNAMV